MALCALTALCRSGASVERHIHFHFSHTKIPRQIVVVSEYRQIIQKAMLRDMHLVWRFNRGHTDALREIYEQHKHQLVTLATALLVDKSEAEDVVHDVFVGFIRSGGKFRLTGSLGGFLATCVANRARNRNKSKRKDTPGDTAIAE